MTQNRNHQFLLSEPQLTFYLKNLKQSISQLNEKIQQEKIKARQLMFSVSALFEISLPRNKIQEQMTKIGIINANQCSVNPQIDEDVQNVSKDHENYVLKKIKNNKQLKRETSIADTNQGPSLNKKRKFEDSRKIENRKSFTKENNSTYHQNKQKQHNFKFNQQAQMMQSSSSLKNQQVKSQSQFSKP